MTVCLGECVCDWMCMGQSACDCVCVTVCFGPVCVTGCVWHMGQCVCDCVFGRVDRGAAKTYSSWQLELQVGQSSSLCLFFVWLKTTLKKLCTFFRMVSHYYLFVYQYLNKTAFEDGNMESSWKVGFIIVEHISNGCCLDPTLLRQILKVLVAFHSSEV